MIDFFSERIGVAYPHTRYSQIAVPDFIFGGMENTSATTLTDLALLDERAALDHDVDGAGLARAGAPVVGRSRDLPRVVRGLAQRRLRDLLRVRLARARQGARRGRRRAAGRRRGLPRRGGALPAPGRVPPVRRADPPLRRHLYEKGGRVLHMLRNELGDDAVLARAEALRRAARARLGRDARSRARHRGGVGAQLRRVLRPLDRARRPPRARVRAGSGTTSATSARCASRRSRRSAPRRRCSSSRRACASRSTARSATRRSPSTPRRTPSSSSCRRARRRSSSIRATSSSRR